MLVPSLADLPDGSDVFLDAGIFIHAFCGRSDQCKELLSKCAREELFGVTSLHVIAEVTHRLMLAEACAIGIISAQKADLLRKKPLAVQGLVRYWEQTRRIFEINLAVLFGTDSWHKKAHAVRLSHGLLTNDSLLVAAMQEHGITSLASADRDFDRVPSLARYEPTDLPRVS